MDDELGKFLCRLMGLGRGREGNIAGLVSLFLVKLELKSCRESLKWLWNCNEESTIDEEKVVLCLLNTYW